MKFVDTVVIGQGLAGSAIAWTLAKQEIDFLVVDDYDRRSSSQIAAGLVTPITGARHVESWAWSMAFPIASQFYEGCELTIGKRFWKVEPAIRFFASQDESDRFQSRYFAERAPLISSSDTSSSDTSSRWIGSPQQFQNELDRTGLGSKVKASWGGFLMPEAARLFTAEYLQASRDYFQSLGRLCTARIDSSEDLIFHRDSITIQAINTQCKQIIFCEGHSAKKNPWFQSMELVPAQGDILTVRIPGLKLDRVLHCGFWIAPIEIDSSNDDSLYHVGSTYRWSPLNGLPNPENRSILSGKLQGLIKRPFEVIDHRAAIRPAGFDHKPMLGSHPDDPRLWILNGLGAKGVLLAPWCAEMLVNTLKGRPSIHDELHWDRKRKKKG